MRAALALDSDLLNDNELSAIETNISQLQAQTQQGNAEDIRNATAALAHSTDDFAAKRMDRNIQRALTGHSIQDM